MPLEDEAVHGFLEFPALIRLPDPTNKTYLILESVLFSLLLGDERNQIQSRTFSYKMVDRK